MLRTFFRRAGIIGAVMTIIIGFSATSAAAALNDCSGSGGIWAGSPKPGVLTNGNLTAGFCRNGTYVRRVNIQYDKFGGGTVTLRFGWRVVSDSYATSGKSVTWDNGAFTQSAGQTRTFRWTYLADITAYKLSSSWKCVQALLEDVRTYALYGTGTVCFG